MTYKQPSRPIPEDRHRRVGMLDVKVASNINVTVQGMTGFLGEDGIWHFESPRPLLPGVPHIYRAQAHSERDGKRYAEIRTVRLIPGRIVDLSFGTDPRSPAHKETR